MSEKGIPLSNIIGFASDSCSTMLVTKNGFEAYLRNYVPFIFVLGCICDYVALCVSHACTILSSYLEQFLKDICCHFSRSSKRMHPFQILTHSPQHRMLKLSQTRWLSRGKVISRILEQWEALVLFLQGEINTDAVKLDGAGEMYIYWLTVDQNTCYFFLTVSWVKLTG